MDTSDRDPDAQGDVSSPDARDAAEDAAKSSCETLPAPHLRWSFDTLDADGFVSEGAEAIVIAANDASVTPNGRFDGALTKQAAHLPWASHHPAFELPEGTLTFWFQVMRIGARQALISKDAVGDGQGHLHIELLPAVDASQTELTVRVQQIGAESTLLSTPAVVEAGKWHFVALRWDRESASLFLDGKAAESMPYPIGLESNSEPLAVGFGTTHSLPGSHLDADLNAENSSNSMFDELVFWGEPLPDFAIELLSQGKCQEGAGT